MLDLPQRPSLPPELLLSSDPPPLSGPARLSLSDRPEHERLPLLREVFLRLGYRYELERLRDTPIDIDLAINLLPGAVIAKGRLYGSRARRTRALTDDDCDDAGLVVNLGGPQLIEQAGKEMVLGDGDAVLISMAHPVSLAHKPPGEMIALRLPRTRLAPLLRGGDDGYMRRIPAGTQALGLLTGYIDLAWDERMVAGPALQQLMSSHIYDLTAVIVGATRDAAHAAEGRGLHAVWLNAVKQDIERSLDQPDLSVDMLAARHRCTRRFLQRLFEADGTTFTEYVLSRRIARAHGQLSDPRQSAEKISSVAYNCGFGDVSYFNRVFRRRYGLAPSDVRAQARLAGIGPEAAAVADDKAARKRRI